MQEKSGFVPNVFLALAHRPGRVPGLLRLSRRIDGEGGRLTKGEREMIVVATSALNQCLYCVVAHGACCAFARRTRSSPTRSPSNYRKADITPRQRAMLDFAMKVSLRVARDRRRRLRGSCARTASHEDAWDIAAIAAFFSLSNRMANFDEHAAERRVLPDGAGAERLGAQCAGTRHTLLLMRQP